MTTIAQIMTKSVATVQRDETLQAAARRMRDMDVGSLPVLDGQAIVGMVTDSRRASSGISRRAIAVFSPTGTATEIAMQRSPAEP